MIFCVEDDEAACGMMLYTLRASGFEAEGFHDGASMFARADEVVPELILLDIMLPGDGGLEVLSRVRADARLRSVPVIVESARGTEYDKVTGLDLGADDYLAKPFGMMEMVSRVKAVLRRASPSHESALVSGEIELDDSRHAVSVRGEPVSLTPREYSLLRFLMENEGLVFSRDRLMSAVWGDGWIGESRTVDVHIGTLRAKLAPNGDRIETVRGVGYRLSAEPISGLPHRSRSTSDRSPA